MKLLAIVLAAAAMSLFAGQAEAMMPLQIPTYDEVIVPAGVAEYKEAATVAVVRPHRAWTPPCVLVRLALFFRDVFPAEWPNADVCGPRERSRRYSFETLEPLKGAPPSSFPAILGYHYPLDPDFMRKTRPDLWGMMFDADAKRAAKLHAGFSFLHRGWLVDRDLDIEAPFDRPRVSDGRISYAVLDPDLDYVVFRDAEGHVQHWEAVLRNGADKDLLVDRLRRLKRGETDVRLTVAPSDLFPRFMDAAIYDASNCKPRLVGGGKLKALDDHVREAFSFPGLAGPARCHPTPQTQLFLALAADPATPDSLSFDEHGAAVRLLPIIDGKIRPSDLVTQLRIFPDTPIPVEQVIAWVGTGPGSEDYWLGGRPQDPPLRLAGR
ncbi:hypothetical protein PMI01_03713 [Caulobacter sp. AP07]|uniref:hypothetical protein n=1 Tax=Caulobacter sp. AP07 TaxID=1144304 RepID=UPI000271FCD5|nr:hypothetical protein [Caulobacter sp. AP07]EJL27588.1 hypothetical protein PMI01_03713 [Caulobacter sp. AP07]